MRRALMALPLLLLVACGGGGDERDTQSEQADNSSAMYEELSPLHGELIASINAPDPATLAAASELATSAPVSAPMDNDCVERYVALGESYDAVADGSGDLQASNELWVVLSDYDCNGGFEGE